MKDTCLVCNSLNYEVIYKGYQGYVAGSFFDIHKCNNCDTHFIITTDDIKKIYNTIYSRSNTAGYERYYRYATSIKTTKNPLRFLAYKEPSYFPIYSFLRRKSQLKILEIGCSYGYLSYALHKSGFDVKALDIAEGAINFAKKNFGDFFYNLDIKEFLKQTDEKFDLIIATEVIEHLKDPNNFLRDCTKLLKKEGQIILTTPDKDFSKKDTFWQTDLPPVHISWLGKKSLEILAKNNNFEVSFQDFSRYYPKNENRFIKYLVSRREIIRSPALNNEGKPIEKLDPTFLHNVVSFVVHKIPFIRWPANLFYNLINGSEMTLGILLKKIPQNII